MIFEANSSDFKFRIYKYAYADKYICIHIHTCQYVCRYIDIYQEDVYLLKVFEMLTRTFPIATLSKLEFEVSFAALLWLPDWKL
jgi:hypothetical protein